jgi:hypothetical protein
VTAEAAESTVDQADIRGFVAAILRVEARYLTVFDSSGAASD